MRARLLLAGLAVVLTATACGSDDSGGTSAEPEYNCTPTSAPTPAKGVTSPLGEVLLLSTDPACGSVTLTLSGTSMSPGSAQVDVGGTVAFTFASDVAGFRVGLEAPRDVKSGTTLIYRFDTQNRYYVTVNGPVVGDVTVGDPTGGPADLATRPPSTPTPSS